MSDSRHFAFLPRSTLTDPLFKALKKSTRLLYAYMVARRAGVDDWFAYSYADIRVDSGYRFESIADGIRELSAGGFLEYKHGGVELNHNRYKLESSWLELGKGTSEAQDLDAETL